MNILGANVYILGAIMYI